MNVLATILGLLAVALFVSSYQLKNRRGIILCNALSRVLYVSQYLLLGAYEGALLDTTAFFISLLCCGRENKFIKKHFALTVILANAVLLGAGALSYRNIFSLLAIGGILFETLALWLKSERNILIVSIIAAPFWLAYNIINMAYGSAIGNVITIVSIIIGIIRIDRNQKKCLDTEETPCL